MCIVVWPMLCTAGQDPPALPALRCSQRSRLFSRNSIRVSGAQTPSPVVDRLIDSRHPIGPLGKQLRFQGRYGSTLEFACRVHRSSQHLEAARAEILIVVRLAIAHCRSQVSNANGGCAGRLAQLAHTVEFGGSMNGAARV